MGVRGHGPGLRRRLRLPRRRLGRARPRPARAGRVRKQGQQRHVDLEGTRRGREAPARGGRIQEARRRAGPEGPDGRGDHPARAVHEARAEGQDPARPAGRAGAEPGPDTLDPGSGRSRRGAVRHCRPSYQTAATRTLATFTRLAKLSPGESSEFSLAQTAEQLGIGNLRLGQTSGLAQIQTAVKAYKKLLIIVTDPATKAQIRAKIKTLAPTATSTKPKKHARKKAGG